MSTDLLTSILDHLLTLQQPDGSFLASSTPGYLGVADGRACPFAPAVYAAEIFQTVGEDMPQGQRTADYIQSHQTDDGHFAAPQDWSGDWSRDRALHSTCIGIRGLRALDRLPAVDPRPWLDQEVRSRDDFGPYEPDFYANGCAALEVPMAPDCEEKLSRVLLDRQDPGSGWIIETTSGAPGWGFPRNNPVTFHATRFFHLAGKRIPQADRILQGFMDVQQANGSWSHGGVHGNFDAATAVRVLSDNSTPFQEAVRRAAEYALTCRTDDGGFRHFSTDPPADLVDHVDYPSEMDATLFHVTTLTMAAMLPDCVPAGNDWIGWGHSLLRSDLETGG